MNAQTAWDVAYNQLQLQLDRPTFETWLRDAVFMGIEQGVYVIGVKNNYAREMLQNRLYRNVRRVLVEVVGEAVELRFEVRKPVLEVPMLQYPHENEMPLFKYMASLTPPPSQDTAKPLHEQIRRPEMAELPESELRPLFNFDRFVVSNSNRMAYEAARAVAENPGRNYNPFMVYGGVGLGKTHLLHAIAHVCKAKGLRTLYVPSEAFTNDLLNSIRQKTTPMFREKYRSVDVLLVDDVQFIAGKEATQEEFFHTFNALHLFNKQIVIASDRSPRELVLLEDRLRSRFEGGLVVDMPALEFETRLAIVQMWASEKSMKLPYAVMEMIANRGSGNVRELEGAFNQVVMEASLGRVPITLQTAETALIRYEAPRLHGRTLDAKDIIKTVANYYKLKPAEITGKGRAQRVNQARQVAMYLCRELTALSLPQIGEAFERSHTTALHGFNKMTEQLETDTFLQQHLADLRRALVGD